MGRILVLAVTIVFTMIAAGVSVAQAEEPYSRMAGRTFTINNVTPFDGTPPCPPANPNTVTFNPSAGNQLKGTVTIVGEFNAASIGVCPDSPYAVPPTSTISYEVYGTWIVFRVPGYVSSALKLVVQNSNLTAISVNDNGFYVSILSDAGRAK